MKEYANAAKNYEILMRKDLEDTREQQGTRGADSGSASPTHHPLVVIFLVAVSNPYLILKSIFMCYEA
jgi:hypothetical protein